ncbi:hypothetical protein CkaCkLH20_11175 [Colletotrichum karsti]|uniref:Large ribosomal subunit protein mL49 n=1 Tax=Colletotrichum karsti TaxID=1095194 RepID=A0A9P6HVQ8_9PEZI|nr:uncharacterized protein CkaCkLH20_11175 [Colletotrichum karsti]KAF9871254.1 hypothetical protein CkaCkLH20_11175 [Colletotrichum karsti]
MRSAITRAVLARPTASAIPRTAFLLPSLRFSSTQSSTPPPPTPAQTQTQMTKAAKPYIIGQTASGYWPVYKSVKSAGSSKYTIIKKIQGDRNALADDIAAQLGVPRADIKINPVTDHIRVKGSYRVEIRNFVISVLGDSDAFKNKPADTTA